MFGWFNRLLGWLLLIGAAGAVSAAEGDAFFESKIRPLLVEHCHECHSAGARKLKAGLYLDSRSGALKGGESGPAIVPGKPELSRLLRAVQYGDVDLQMPPRRKLADEQIADLKAWIAMGAPWPGGEAEPRVAAGGFDLEQRKAEFWAWQPIRNPLPPAVKDGSWPRDDIDRFVAAKLDEAGLAPGPDADRRTLLRRLTFDLTGLPPTPSEIHGFLADNSERAWERVVDRLLESPRFGERWARHWLDMVRYSETLGHEFDYAIHNAWRYRDYVIRAFNADVPYDQFMKEHVAGDLLAEPRRHPVEGFNESVIGTAFYWFGQQKHSPVDIRQETADTIDNQIDVLTKTFMGMTVSCARCHDHKFDAISTEDYYALFGVLGSSRYAQAAIDEMSKVEPLRRQLAGVADQIEVEMRRGVSPELARAEAYLDAAVRLRREAEENGDRSTLVFEDFENGIDEWEVTGDAFSGPQTQGTIGRYQGDVNARGRYFINSHNVTHGGTTTHSDRFTGTLTSPEFVVERRHIHFLIGGGAHRDATCVNLLINGKPVMSVTGKNSNRMEPARFDVREWRGHKARLQAVDLVKGGWGNIGWDHIVFSDRESFFGDQSRPEPGREEIAEAAHRAGLDEGTLRRWVRALSELKELRRCDVAEQPGNFESLGEGDFADWFRDGSALVNAPEVRVETGGQIQLREKGWMDSRGLGERLQGALRSPTFEITRDYVHLLVAGQGARVNAVVDNFTVIKNPIWGGLKREIGNAKPHWLTIDLRMVKGHRAWVELLDQTVGDPGGRGSYPADAWFAVRRVLLSDSAKPPVLETEHPLATDGTRLSPERMRQVAATARAVVSDWERRRPADSANLAVLNWLSRAGLAWHSEKLARLVARYEELAASVPDVSRTPGMVEGTGGDEHVFIRGNPRNRGRVASRAFLAALRADRAYDTPLSGRDLLARDLVDRANPLPARVIVNKVWHHLFGRGIVATVDNFGVLGERPSHPDLLDHLAHSLREDGWSLKRLIRRIVLSRSYRLSSRPADAKAERLDPNNLLLHRANVKRLEGEAIRDAMLSVSGSLRKEMFGEPVPVHLTAFMEGRGRPRSGPLDGDNRRSIYTAVRRNFLSPMMLAFDTPLPATTVGRRALSNVPAQALILMNDELVGLLARRWAERLATGADDARIVGEMYETAFGRLPSIDETAMARSFLREQAELYAGADARTLALADLAHVLFNVKEFVFLN